MFERFSFWFSFSLAKGTHLLAEFVVPLLAEATYEGFFEVFV